jgi:hypothetical protein
MNGGSLENIPLLYNFKLLFCIYIYLFYISSGRLIRDAISGLRCSKLIFFSPHSNSLIALSAVESENRRNSARGI